MRCPPGVCAFSATPNVGATWHGAGRRRRPALGSCQPSDPLLVIYPLPLSCYSGVVELSAPSFIPAGRYLNIWGRSQAPPRKFYSLAFSPPDYSHQLTPSEPRTRNPPKSTMKRSSTNDSATPRAARTQVEPRTIYLLPPAPLVAPPPPSPHCTLPCLRHCFAFASAHLGEVEHA